ncbi:MAG: cysteine dioxygenase family protein [Vicinamibacteria bacterium]
MTRLQEACADGPDAAAIDAILAGFRPSLESLAPWIAFDEARYTRTRLHRSDAFELLLLCWDRGQATPVHDHDGQAGWFTVLEGALGVQEYERDGGPADLRTLAAQEETAPGGLRLHEGLRYVVEAGRSVAEAEGPETIHRVGPVGGRALSLHLYAGPLDSFLMFDAARGTAKRLSVA